MNHTCTRLDVREKSPRLLHGLRQSNCRGVTLVEVLAAMALASLMLVAITGVLRDLMLQRRQVETLRPKQWQSSADRLFWNDLAQSRFVALEFDRFAIWRGNSLVVYSWTLPVSDSTNTYRPLTRTEFEIDTLPNVGTQRPNVELLVPIRQQVVLWNVNHVAFSRVDSTGHAQPIPQTASPAPRALAYRIELDSTILERTISVR